jgi:probable blue pigment (indigoidine) exporter
LGFCYVSFIATALAFVAWFTRLRHLPGGAVGLIGLLNPVTGVLLGTLVASESLGPRQLAGMLVVLLGVILAQPTVADRFRDHRQTAQSDARHFMANHDRRE